MHQTSFTTLILDTKWIQVAWFWTASICHPCWESLPSSCEYHFDWCSLYPRKPIARVAIGPRWPNSNTLPRLYPRVRQLGTGRCWEEIHPRSKHIPPNMQLCQPPKRPHRSSKTWEVKIRWLFKHRKQSFQPLTAPVIYFFVRMKYLVHAGKEHQTNNLLPGCCMPGVRPKLFDVLSFLAHDMEGLLAWSPGRKDIKNWSLETQSTQPSTRASKTHLEAQLAGNRSCLHHLRISDQAKILNQWYQCCLTFKYIVIILFSYFFIKIHSCSCFHICFMNSSPIFLLHCCFARGPSRPPPSGARPRAPARRGSGPDGEAPWRTTIEPYSRPRPRACCFGSKNMGEKHGEEKNIFWKMLSQVLWNKLDVVVILRFCFVENTDDTLMIYRIIFVELWPNEDWGWSSTVRVDKCPQPYQTTFNVLLRPWN